MSIGKQMLMNLIVIYIFMLRKSTSHIPRPAFAGFGSKSSVPKKKNKASKSTQTTKQKILNPVDPQSRMEYISSRIQRADISPLRQYENPNTVVCIDNFLGPELVIAMRKEAEALMPRMVPSQSTRWDETTQSVIPYEKEGVISYQVEGGPDGYAASPILVEYIVTLTQQLSRKINEIVPSEFQLSDVKQTNKLAVCLGGGSKYDKHIDNLGGGQGDRRKLTALLYLQPPGSHDTHPDDNGEHDPRGGYFRAYDVPMDGMIQSFAPRGDRLLIFWSDSLVHDVSPSFVIDESTDKRWAITVWLIANDSGKIHDTDVDVEQRHFGLG
jgi:2OG-Fe(II) oxygenase superfamily